MIAQGDELLAHELPSATDFDFAGLDIETVMQSFEPHCLPDNSQTLSTAPQSWWNGGYDPSLDENLGTGFGELFDPLIGIGALSSQFGGIEPDTEQSAGV